MTTNSHPNWMTFDDRMTEVAGILAAGILRAIYRSVHWKSTARGLDRCAATLR